MNVIDEVLKACNVECVSICTSHVERLKEIPEKLSKEPNYLNCAHGLKG